MIQAANKRDQRSEVGHGVPALLEELLMTPSPSGNEQQIQRLIRQRMEDVVEHCESDALGNLILGINIDKKNRVLLAGHCDQIGFIVKYISPGGDLYLDSVGGNDYAAAVAAHVTVYGKHGPIDGVFGRKPIHMQSNKEMNEVPTLSRMWIDIGAKDEKEAEEHVQLGDYVTFQLKTRPLMNHRVAAP